MPGQEVPLSLDRARCVVVDTNILMTDPLFWEVLAVDEVVIPEVVLHELDGLKKADGRVGFEARGANRMLGQLAELGPLLQGVRLQPGTVVRVVRIPPAWRAPVGLKRTADHAVIATALYLLDREHPRDLLLLSNDAGVRAVANIHDVRCLTLEKAFEQFRYVEPPPPVVCRDVWPLTVGAASSLAVLLYLAHARLGAEILILAALVWGLSRVIGTRFWQALRNLTGARPWRPLAGWVEMTAALAWVGGLLLLLPAQPFRGWTITQAVASSDLTLAVESVGPTFTHGWSVSGGGWGVAAAALAAIPALVSLLRLPRGPLPRRVWERRPFLQPHGALRGAAVLGLVAVALWLVVQRFS